jgi:hypothetical protein
MVDGILIRPLIVVNVVLGVWSSNILLHLLLTLPMRFRIDTKPSTKVVFLDDRMEQKFETEFKRIVVDVRSLNSRHHTAGPNGAAVR